VGSQVPLVLSGYARWAAAALPPCVRHCGVGVSNSVDAFIRETIGACRQHIDLCGDLHRKRKVGSLAHSVRRRRADQSQQQQPRPGLIADVFTRESVTGPKKMTEK